MKDREIMDKNTVIPEKRDDVFRILHTADWHLGKLLNEQSRDEEHEAFLTWLLAAVKEHRVDTIILAGDVFDSANPPQSATKRYFDFVSILFRQGNCSLVVIAGNHDSAAQLEAPKQALRALNVHLAGFLAEKLESRILCLPDEQNPKVAIAMLPFMRDRDLRLGRAGEDADEIRSGIVAGIRQRYAEAADSLKEMKIACPAIATGHLTVLGARTSDSEREIHIGGLGSVTAASFPERFSYVALGHLHCPQSTDESGRVRYAGSPIALSFSEANDVKEIRILDVSKSGIVQFGLPIPVFRRLVQIRCPQANLEQALKEFSSGQVQFQTWAEVIVEDALFEDDLNERVHLLGKAHGLEVLKVLRGNPAAFIGMSAGEATDDEAIGTLLDQPVHIFEHLLNQHGQLDEGESAKLKTAFRTLVDMDSLAEGKGIS